MNKQRRKQIAECVRDIEIIKSRLEDILSDEELAFDSMPENLQSSIRGEESETSMEILNEAIDSLQEINDALIEI